METKKHLQLIHRYISEHPLFSVLERFIESDIISDEECNEKIKSIKYPKFEKGVLYSFQIPDLKEKPFHHLRMFLKNVDVSLINENSFTDFIQNEILNGKTEEENINNLENAKKLLNALAMYSEYITPIQQEAELLADVSEVYRKEDIFWNTTYTSEILGVGRKTIYNWLKEEDFSANKGKLNINKLADYLERKNPKYLTKLQNHLS